jgi:hypothetical protein
MQEVSFPHITALGHRDGELEAPVSLLAHYHSFADKHEEFILHRGASSTIGTQTLPAHLRDGLQTTGGDGQT